MGVSPTFFCFVKLARKNMSDALETVVTKQLEPLGLELFELHSRGTKSRPVIDVRIERLDGGKVTVEDCARASRAIESKLDEGGIAAGRCVLEVSSPGIERPLRNARDFTRFIGRDAVVTADPSESSEGLSSKEVRLIAVEGADGSELVMLEDASGATHRIPLAAIKKARLAFNWKR